jgi:uncharacterized protein (DUF4415 family)
MQFLNKIATAFKNKDGTDNILSETIEKAKEVAESLSPKAAAEATPIQEQPKSPPKKELSPPPIEKKGLQISQDILEHPKYKPYFDKLEEYKAQYEEVRQELKKMEYERKEIYKKLFDTLNGQITANFNTHPELGREIYRQNRHFSKYTKLSELYWALLGHPVYGKLIPVSTVNEGYYYTANGIVYYGNDSREMGQIKSGNTEELYIDPMVMYFTYFNGEKMYQEQETAEQEELQRQLQEEFDKQAKLQEEIKQHQDVNELLDEN